MNMLRTNKLHVMQARMCLGENVKSSGGVGGWPKFFFKS